jgi:hypothetical protein
MLSAAARLAMVSDLFIIICILLWVKGLGLFVVLAFAS